jgi:hypothetical protein
VKKQDKIALAILVIGLAVIGIYKFASKEGQKIDGKPLQTIIQEQIILPQYPAERYRSIPEVQHYLSDLKEMITKGISVLPLDDDELDETTRKIQALLLKDPQFLADTRQNGKILHNDMMRIVPALSSNLDTHSRTLCNGHKCYLAEKYNFVTNTTTRAIVDADTMKIVSLKRYSDMQPDISRRLRNIAIAIALKAPEVAKELEHTPRRKEITMANVRGSMKESPCENTTHLCVAPTFADHQKARALWAVVDLTQMRLAAAKWAGLGKTTTPACIGERSLQNRYIMENFCQKDTLLEKNGWRLHYRLTGSDGLEIRDVTFKGKSVLTSAKIVDWHVSYQQQSDKPIDTTTEAYVEGRRVEFVQGDNGSYMFGYNDAMGCPLFSTSVVLAFNGPQIHTLPKKDGFMLTQDFRNPKWPMACNYRYENRFEFYDDGSFRIVGVNKGRGCGDNAIYRPVMRIDMKLSSKERFYAHTEDGWKVKKEEFSEKVTADTPYPYKITASEDPDRGYFIEPNHGQFHDHSRGDHARLFVTAFHPDEGDTDLLTLGSCCKLDEEGVERYLNNEPIIDTDIVIWYVPHIRNDAREGHEYCWADTVIGDDGNLLVKVWPCTVGPKFIPIHPQ